MLGLLIFGALVLHEHSVPELECYGLPDSHWENQQ